MYQDLITSPDQALVHLAFHCCFKDGEMQTEELDLLSTTFAAKGLNKNLDFSEEAKHYQSYSDSLIDEPGFLKYLIDLIHPKNKLALFTFCVQIVYKDESVSIPEEVLLNKIAGILSIKDSDNLTIQKLVLQLNEVEKRNAF